MSAVIILIIVITILTALTHIHFSPLPSVNPPITPGHHTEFPLDNTNTYTHRLQWHNSSISSFNRRNPTIHSSCLHSRYITPSRTVHQSSHTLTLLLTHVSLTIFTLSPDCTSNKDISKMPSYTSRTFPQTEIDDGQLNSQTCIPTALEHSLTHHSKISTFTA